MAKSRARKIREKRMREGMMNPARNRGSYALTDMRTRKTKTKHEVIYQDKYGELSKVDHYETDGSSFLLECFGERVDSFWVRDCKVLYSVFLQ